MSELLHSCESANDQELILAMQNSGDQDSFRELMERYKGPLLSLFGRKKIEYNEALELMNETWLKVWEHRDEFNSSAKFLPWLATIAQRTAIDFLRRSSHQRKQLSLSREVITDADTGFDSALEDRHLFSDPAHIAEHDESFKTLKCIVRREMAGRITRMQQVFDRYIDLDTGELTGATLEEIAQELEIPLGTVKSSLNASRQGIQRRIRPHFMDPRRKTESPRREKKCESPDLES